MTDLVTETREGYAAWHPERGFDFWTARRSSAIVKAEFGAFICDGWRVVPVTITLTATATGLRPVTEIIEPIVDRAKGGGT